MEGHTSQQQVDGVGCSQAPGEGARALDATAPQRLLSYLRGRWGTLYLEERRDLLPETKLCPCLPETINLSFVTRLDKLIVNDQEGMSWDFFRKRGECCGRHRLWWGAREAELQVPEKAQNHLYL